MRGRIGALALCCCGIALAAEPRTTVADLVNALTASLAVDRSDFRISRQLYAIRLSESLSDSTIDILRQMGAGPATVHELEMLGKKSRSLPRPEQEPLSFIPRPSPSETSTMVASLRLYSAGYLAGLPDFTCTREGRLFVAYSFNDPRLHPRDFDARVPLALTRLVWQPAGSYTADVGYVGGADHYKLKLVDNTRTSKTFDEFHGKVAWGEFAGMMKEIFRSAPDLTWDHWQTSGGKTAAVFTYSVDAAHSGYRICCPAMITAHRGFVYADPQTGQVLRLIIDADLPERAPVVAAAYLLDYGEVEIAGKRHLLPRTASTYVHANDIEERDEIHYSDYRKFDANATIVFPTEGTKERDSP
jgi:hypothetical protein